MSVKIIYKNCVACKACYNQCPADVFGWDRKNNIPYVAYVDECSHCGVCALECKSNAISHTLPPNCFTEINKRFMSSVRSPEVIEWPEK